MTFKVSFNEDGDSTILGRVTARNGTGAATGVNGEGKWVQQADVSSIAYTLFDLDAPTTAVSTGTLTVANVIIDTPVTSQEIWTEDAIGYNFIHDLAGSNFPTGGKIIRVEYLITLTGGAKLPGAYEGPVCDRRSS